MSGSILLTGARGSGKSTIGRLLATRLGWPFVDLDDRVLAMFDQASVGEVWRVHGEQAWRAAEVDALRRVLTEPQCIVAMGGGVAEIDDARALIAKAKAEGDVRVVFLRASVATLADRLRAAPGDRPALTDAATLEDEIATILARREPHHRAVADLTTDVDSRSQTQVCDLIMQWIGGSDPEARA